MINRNSAKCLNVTGASVADGASVIQWRCQSDHTNDRWYLVGN
jgi:hypothetical protein